MNEYIIPIKEKFESAANPQQAAQMKAYLKNQFEFYGIASPQRKQIVQDHKETHGLLPENNKAEIVQWCWSQPQREWQYFAMNMLGRTAKKEADDILSLYEFLVVHKSWWDTVDFIAANLVGQYFRLYPDKIAGATAEWMASGNMWLQRTCLLYQLKYKNELDTELLESFIQPLVKSKEFFIRKAIGWILREYSKTNPDYVRSFVSRTTLSGLSHREALKWLNRKSL
jgi:3-methyladenine DNA glycosylase AlkD